MYSQADFPNLSAGSYRVTSPATGDYNCIAWCAGDVEHWWQPGVSWPFAVSREEFGVDVLIQAFRCLGFEVCADDKLEEGFEKVAIYGDSVWYAHAARQLPSGKWTSKLGRAEDIEHDSPEDLAGGVYGQVIRFMSRAIGKRDATREPLISP